MAVYFFDTSGLVKRYVAEVGTTWVQSITDPVAGHTIFIAQITGVEVITAITKKVRNKETTSIDAAKAIADFRYDFANQYDPVEISELIIVQAMALGEKHPLRAYDAVQLAVALTVNSESLNLGIPAVILVSADKGLNDAAIAEGLGLEDPRSYP